MTPARAALLAKLIWSLHQENDGERVNAARAISRQLAAEGVTLEELTVLLGGKPPQAVTDSEEREQRDMIRRCRYSSLITTWEKLALDRYEASINLGGPLTRGERINLQSLFDRLVPKSTRSA